MRTSTVINNFLGYLLIFFDIQVGYYRILGFNFHVIERSSEFNGLC
jgi:hypothetical protein